jgi:hypothetical protein
MQSRLDFVAWRPYGIAPALLNGKKRAALITYRHSESERFENAFVPQSNVNDL